MWDKVFKNGPSKICGRQPLKNFSWSILECFVSYVKAIFTIFKKSFGIHGAVAFYVYWPQPMQSTTRSRLIFSEANIFISIANCLRWWFG